LILLDANILLYLSNLDAPEHAQTKRWMDNLLEGPQWIGLPWVTIWAFIRISTNRRLFPTPLTVSEAFQVIHKLLAAPRVMIVQPGPRHSVILEKLLTEHQAAGPLVTDAVLAALAMEQGASVASTDEDFRRFPEVHWINPLR
jgi:hypothetical protein